MTSHHDHAPAPTGHHHGDGLHGDDGPPQEPDCLDAPADATVELSRSADAAKSSRDPVMIMGLHASSAMAAAVS